MRDRITPLQILLRSPAQLTLLDRIASTLPIDADHPIEVIIREQPKKRSSLANRYYWSVINQIASDAWVEDRQYTPDVWHEYAKRKHLGTIELPGGGIMAISTADLDVSEFAQYVERVEAWAATELGVTFIEAHHG